MTDWGGVSNGFAVRYMHRHYIDAQRLSTS